MAARLLERTQMVEPWRWISALSSAIATAVTESSTLIRVPLTTSQRIAVAPLAQRLLDLPPPPPPPPTTTSTAMGLQ